MTAARLASTVHPHEWALGDLPTGDAPRAARWIWIQRAFHQLTTGGLSAIEAGNVVAYVAGLHASETGWSTRQIERLVDLRARVVCGVVAS